MIGQREGTTSGLTPAQKDDVDTMPPTSTTPRSDRIVKRHIAASKFHCPRLLHTASAMKLAISAAASVSEALSICFSVGARHGCRHLESASLPPSLQQLSQLFPFPVASPPFLPSSSTLPPSDLLPSAFSFSSVCSKPFIFERARFFRAQRASPLIGHLCTTSAIAIIAVAVADRPGRPTEALISLSLSSLYFILHRIQFYVWGRARELVFHSCSVAPGFISLCSIRPTHSKISGRLTGTEGANEIIAILILLLCF